MTEAPHHLPLQNLARRLRKGDSVQVGEIKTALDAYLLAMASFSLIDVETWFQNILSQMAPICLCEPAAEEMTLNVLLVNWHQMGFDDFESVMESLAYMRERCTDHDYDLHRKQWLENLIMSPELIAKLIDNHPSTIMYNA